MLVWLFMLRWFWIWLLSFWDLSGASLLFCFGFALRSLSITYFWVVEFFSWQLILYTGGSCLDWLLLSNGHLWNSYLFTSTNAGLAVRWLYKFYIITNSFSGVLYLVYTSTYSTFGHCSCWNCDREAAGFILTDSVLSFRLGYDHCGLLYFRGSGGCSVEWFRLTTLHIWASYLMTFTNAALLSISELEVPFKDLYLTALIMSELSDLWLIGVCRHYIWISEEEIVVLAAPFEFFLVENFPSNHPSLESIRKFFFNLKLISDCSMTLLDAKNVLTKLSNDLDYYRFFHIIIILSIIIFLHPHIFSPHILYGLGSLFSWPLCIKMQLMWLLALWLRPDSLGYVQSVMMEDLPSFCDHYKAFDHDKKECGLYAKNGFYCY
ncbi:hypothetical protein IEQ34_014583 [Dendrobium chrysotoxum]|uniref:Uncharacterized protein n=1 Tax=Dendrobium chrysotoxum TaxID=161865 RepID=A0AAV7GJH8_DENCH|nr:hypothetical protein IEQ34_014583 [Dendrobium chrysotoxum]